MRLTTGQALVRFLAAQSVARDGVEHRFFGGCFGIFGHGNVAGLGEALLEAGDGFRYYQGRNEQAMVHAASGYARARLRLGALACTTSIGPGATNLVTGAAVATINRLPVLLLPGDVFASRRPDPVLQQLEAPGAGDVSVNDCLRPVSRYWDRITRPEQLVPAALEALRVLTDPAQTGAVTLALPQDVQAMAHDWPEDFLAPRVWPIWRPAPDPVALDRAADRLRGAERPLLVAGGGVLYSEATDALLALAESAGIPVGETQAGKGAMPDGHPLALGAIGATGTSAANAIARRADLVIGVGTRWTDFTTASHTAFQHPDVRFVNVNVAPFDAARMSGLALVGDARATLEALSARLTGHRTAPEYGEEAGRLVAAWQAEVARLVGERDGDPPAQAAIIGAVNAAAGPETTVVCAAGSMPGDLHKLWRPGSPAGYHVEYGYSCMGYEVAGGLGFKLGAPDRDVVVLVGDGSWLMLSSEIVTAVAEGVKLTIVLVDNAGYASIGSLSRSVGADGFGTRYQARAEGTLGLDTEPPGPPLPVDLAANAESLGAQVIRACTIADLEAALAQARAATGTVVIHVPADRYAGVPGYDSWWDVPVAEVSGRPAVQEARAAYDEARGAQRDHVTPP